VAFTDVGDVGSDFLRRPAWYHGTHTGSVPECGSGKAIFLNNPLGDQGSSLRSLAVPGRTRPRMYWPRASSPWVNGRAVSEDVHCVRFTFTFFHQRTLVEAGFWLERFVLGLTLDIDVPAFGPLRIFVIRHSAPRYGWRRPSRSTTTAACSSHTHRRSRATVALHTGLPTSGFSSPQVGRPDAACSNPSGAVVHRRAQGMNSGPRNRLLPGVGGHVHSAYFTVAPDGKFVLVRTLPDHRSGLPSSTLR